MAQELSSPTSPHVVVLGGGISGMAAACRLLDSGRRVSLVEKRPYLGGRAFSFVDRETGQEVDNGQHVFLGCCTYYIEFLKKLGTLDQTYLQPKLEVKVMDPRGKTGKLSASFLPNPLHSLPSFLAYRHLGAWEKLMGVVALLRIKYSDRTRADFERQSFYDWLKRNRQSDRAVDNFWNLIIKPCANDDVRSVSASMGMMIIQEGLLRTKGGGRVGYARVGLSKLMGQAAERYIEERGGRLVLGRSATAILVQDGAATGVRLDNGESLSGDALISALPADALLPLLPDEAQALPYFAAVGQLTTAPIVNVHLWYDRPVMKDHFAAFVDSPLQWVFNRGSILGSNGAEGRHISISLSGAFEYINQPKEQVQDMMVQAMARAFPAAAEARLERALVVKQDKATFRCLPGTEALRPQAVTPVKGLYLAGEWTDTGWPSTMEGAVRSGVAAVDAVAAGAGL